jgi:hypothetical protein
MNVRKVTIRTLKESVRHTATGLEANEECLHDVRSIVELHQYQLQIVW